MATYSSFKQIDNQAIISQNITNADIATGGVPTAAFAANSVRTTDIASATVGTTQLATTLDFSGKTMTYRPFVNGDFASRSITGSQLASGASTSNIGYTTVNKAGDSLTGNLIIPASSVSAPGVAASNNTNTGVFFPSTSQVNITTAGTTASNFNKYGGGIAQMQPNIPAFTASGSGGWYYRYSSGWIELIAANGWWTWQVTAQKGGSNFAPGGRFTAPVAGWYSFYSQSYMYNDTSNSGGYLHYNIGYNGSPSTDRSTGRTPHTLYGHQVTNGYVPGINASLEIYLNAGDFSSPQPNMGGASSRLHGDHSLWCGYLIG
jgi:hypothetical protein